MAGGLTITLDILLLPEIDGLLIPLQAVSEEPFCDHFPTIVTYFVDRHGRPAFRYLRNDGVINLTFIAVRVSEPLLELINVELKLHLIPQPFSWK